MIGIQIVNTNKKNEACFTQKGDYDFNFFFKFSNLMCTAYMIIALLKLVLLDRKCFLGGCLHGPIVCVSVFIEI